MLLFNCGLRARVRAILLLKKLEATARERGDWVAPTDELDEAYENEFGKLEIGCALHLLFFLLLTNHSLDENANADMKFEDMNSRLPPQVFIDEELDPAEMRACVA